ncbi:hypothetical protein ACS0TY_032347 [Phlomoides rotata]
MPSGAKKRKAAKKKKENQYNNPSHPNAGDEDRESDVGENRSPKSQGERDEIAEGSRVKSDEKHVEVGESEDEGSSQSGSNSDDENQSSNPSHPNEDEDRESDVGENMSPKSQGEGDEIAEGSRVKSDEKHVEVGESEDDESDQKHEHDGGSSQSGSNSDDENQGGVINTKAESSIDSTKVDDSVSIEATCNSPMDDSVMGEKITVLIEQVEVDNEQSLSDTVLIEQVEVDNEQSLSDISVDVVQSAIKENGEKKFGTSVEDKISSSLERTIDLSDSNPANNTKSEDPGECVKQEFDDTTALQHYALRPNDGAQHVKDSLVIQPVPPSLYPGEKMSWKSCCGLFEVFTRSAA